MRWFSIFTLFFSLFSPITCFQKPLQKVIQKIPYVKPNPKYSTLIYSEKPYSPTPSRKELPLKKFHHFLTLIRFHTILPTTLLNFIGGWIINPSFNDLIHSQPFIVSGIITQCILASSMIVNDLCDIETDRINSPGRPLVTGKITIPEAIIATNSLLWFAECLNMALLPPSIQYITHEAIMLILLYTPVLKRIPLVKNLACASLVSFSMFFSGLAVTVARNELIAINSHYGLLLIAMSTIFWGSLSNEIVLDIKDHDGDKENKIITLPVLLSKKVAWLIATITTGLNIFSNTLSLAYIYKNMEIGFIYCVIMSPLFINLFKVYREKFTRDSDIIYMRKSNKPMFLFFLYIFILANISMQI